jgi:hypothetical protein
MQVAPLRYNRTEFVPRYIPSLLTRPFDAALPAPVSNAGECKVGGGESNVS